MITGEMYLQAVTRCLLRSFLALILGYIYDLSGKMFHQISDDGKSPNEINISEKPQDSEQQLGFTQKAE